MSERATPSPRLSPLPGHGTPARNSLRTAVSGLSAFHPSIRAVLTGMLAGWAGFVILVAVIGSLSLAALTVRTASIDRMQVTTSRLLGELNDQLSQFRIAEMSRALTNNEAARRKAESSAIQHRRAIGELEARLAEVLGGDASRLAGLRRSWTTYSNAHDFWQWGEAGVITAEDGGLNQLYRDVAIEIEKLNNTISAASRAEFDKARTLTSSTFVLMFALSLLAAAMAAVFHACFKSWITDPLRAMTSAMWTSAGMARARREADESLPSHDRADEIGMLAKAFGAFRDRTLALEQLQLETLQAQERTSEIALHDMLTGLRSRRSFAEDVLKAVNRGGDCTLMIIELDHFGLFNDLHGYAAGDAVLRETARRIRDLCGEAAIIARLGGDEFGVLMREIPAATRFDAVALTAALLTRLRQAIAIDGSEMNISASIGVAQCTGKHADADVLMRSAGHAMYRVKQNGRGSVCFFEPGIDIEIRARLALEKSLRRAIEADLIKPYYQPLVRLRDDRVHGFEILARWNDPELGAIAPDIFIPIAEQLGLIANLTWSLLRQACRDARHWPDEIRLALNVSPLQLRMPEFPAQLCAALEREAFPCTRLEIEITETALAGDVKTIRSALESVRALGIKVSLDDFGTGYSSLCHLREFKIDKLKIDRSFVQAMHADPECGKIVDAILGLSKSLGLATVAEGIENAAVCARLAADNCEFGQGWFFGKAMSAQEVTIDLFGSRAGTRAVA